MEKKYGKKYGKTVLQSSEILKKLYGLKLKQNTIYSIIRKLILT